MSDTYPTDAIDENRIINPYLEKIRVNPNEFWESKELPIVNIRFIILMTLHDYFRKKLTFEEVAAVGEAIYWNTEVWNHNDFMNLDRKLDKVLVDISDLYTIEKTTEKELAPLLRDYYEKYKYIIEPYLKK